MAFADLPFDDKLEYVRAQIEYWRSMQKSLYRRRDALTDGEKTAIDAKITTEATKLEVVVKDAEPITELEAK